MYSTARAERALYHLMKLKPKNILRKKFKRIFNIVGADYLVTNLMTECNFKNHKIEKPASNLMNAKIYNIKVIQFESNGY